MGAHFSSKVHTFLVVYIKTQVLTVTANEPDTLQYFQGGTSATPRPCLRVPMCIIKTFSNITGRSKQSSELVMTTKVCTSFFFLHYYTFFSITALFVFASVLILFLLACMLLLLLYLWYK